MMNSKRRRWGSKANEAMSGFAGRIDDQTGEVATHAAGIIVMAVRVLRLPTLAILVVPWPFIVGTAVIALASDGGVQVFGLVIAVAMAAVSGLFAFRRMRILRAADEPEALATELGIMVSMSPKVDETRGALTTIAGGGGWRVFSRLKGLWSGVGMTGRWIDGIGDLPRARYFAPPRIGTTVTLTIAALWLIPISVVATVLFAIAALARAV